MPDIRTCFDLTEDLERLVYEQRGYIREIAEATKADNYTPKYYKCFLALLGPIFGNRREVSESVTVYEFLDMLRQLRDTGYYERLNASPKHI